MSKHCRLSALPVMLASVIQASAYAAPIIDQASAAAVDGVEFTLTGSGFGSRAGAAKLWDTVDNQSSYLSLPGVDGSVANLVGRSVPVGPTHVFQINTFSFPGAVIFSNASLRHPQQTLYYRTSNAHGYLQWPNVLGGESAPGSQTELYLSVWIRPDSSVDTAGHSSKFVRVWDDPNGAGTRISWTQMHMTVVDSAGYSATSWAGWQGAAGQWNRLELFVSAPNKLVRAWTNGRLVHNITDFRKDAAFAARGLNVSRLGWDPGGTSPPPVDVSFGDVYIDTTLARVELCEQPTWEQCSAREVQQTTSWADDRIVFKVSRGLLSGSTLYAYVVDAQGAVNSLGAALVSSVPNPPTNLVVE